MAVVGISGSPFPNGNTDRMVKALLERSGKEHTFANLSTLRYDPCRGCARLCAKTNLCPLEDDLRPYMEPIRDAEALVLGTPVHNGFMTAWLFSFISRIWCFHHVKDLLRGKPVVIVVTTLFEQTGRIAAERVAEYLNSWHSRSLKILGNVVFVSESPPCYKCGMGKQCHVGGLWAMVGQDEQRLQDLKISKKLFLQWEDCEKTVQEVEKYGELLSRA